MSTWNAHNIPDQTGRVAIVTGANTGIGYVTALELARKGAHVIVASRSETKGRDAIARMKEENLAGEVVFEQLDLADLASVRAFAERFAASHARLDLLINNAGVMMPAERQTTADGFEVQIGTNHYGHFALTGLLMDRILATPGARVVNVSSLAHNGGRIDFDDLHSERKSYRRMGTYSQSKLANMLFSAELDRKLHALGADAMSLAVHPGWTATDLQRHHGLASFLNPFFAQKPDMGALPTLYAATAPEAERNGYYGPNGWREMRGHPGPAVVSAAARNERDAARLWQMSEQATGVSFVSPVRAAA